MKMETLPKHFIRVASSNELATAEHAFDYMEGLIISQPFVLKRKNSISETLEKSNKPFLIDPETYRYFFQKKFHYRQKRIRSWLNDMAQLMPDEIKNTFGIRKAEPSNFDELQMIEFCKTNIDIQTSLTKSDGNPLLPIALLCPYMLINDENFSSALQFHVQLINTMIKINKTKLPIIACLYLSKELLDRPNRLGRIVDIMRNIDCFAVAVWIDDFDETVVDEEKLESLKNFYFELSKTKYVISMYGGTAQIMMMYYGLSSITHGIHYQMHRNGKTERGGPAHYFYIPNLRHRIRTIEASSIIERQNFSRKEYLEKVCKCPVCDANISYSPGSTILSLEGNRGNQVEYLTKHFVYNKNIEVKKTEILSEHQYTEWLIQMANQLRLTLDEQEYVDTVKKWISAIFDIDLENESKEEFG